MPIIPQLRAVSRRNSRLIFKFLFPHHHPHHSISNNVSNLRSLKNSISETLCKRSLLHFVGIIETPRFVHSLPEFEKFSNASQDPFDKSAVFVQNLVKFRRHKSTEEVEQALDLCDLVISDDFVLNVLRRHRSDWKSAYVFFNWASKGVRGNVYLPNSDVCNEMLDILGKMKRFDELHRLLVEMSKRNGLINEGTYDTLLNRYSAAHKVQEAIGIFYKRKEFGLELNLAAFQTLLMWLCRYKHVEDAETLFRNKMNEFHFDIKTWNIILNGWCVLGNVLEAKRFWKDVIASRRKPDVYTFGTFIKALTKKGKLGTALKVFRGMWDKGCVPDVVICNCIIDQLCFKKRIPEALQVFEEMKERGCLPNAATYNSLIKYLCKIKRMEKVDELVREMEDRRGNCLPNAVTYSYLLNSLKEPGEIPVILKRMETNGCTVNDDIYNLILRLYMKWDHQEGVRHTWEEMERCGQGPDRRSYTIMIHGYYDKGRRRDVIHYFREMTSKGMVAEPRTEKLVNDMNI